MLNELYKKSKAYTVLLKILKISKKLKSDE